MADLDRFQSGAVLKRDLFGAIERGVLTTAAGDELDVVRRRVGAAPWWTRPVARWLARREARALAAAATVPSIPRLVSASRSEVVRTWLAGAPMMAAPRPPEREYFRAARRLLVALHRAGVAHNDTAKEPNWLVAPDGAPGLLDFQLAWTSRRRGRFFRLLAREDLRHLLKHKRTYCPDELTASERALLANPSLAARGLRTLAKPIYTLVTRRWLGWQDREGRSQRP